MCHIGDGKPLINTLLIRLVMCSCAFMYTICREVVGNNFHCSCHCHRYLNNNTLTGTIERQWSTLTKLAIQSVSPYLAYFM